MIATSGNLNRNQTNAFKGYPEAMGATYLGGLMNTKSLGRTMGTKRLGWTRDAKSRGRTRSTNGLGRSIGSIILRSALLHNTHKANTICTFLPTETFNRARSNSVHLFFLRLDKKMKLCRRTLKTLKFPLDRMSN